VAALAYATVLGKGNTKDGLSRLLTQVSQVRKKKGKKKARHARGLAAPPDLLSLSTSHPTMPLSLPPHPPIPPPHTQGYFQPDLGGANIPTAAGELSDLAGDEPLFKALYGWFIENGGVFKLAFGPKAFIVVSDPVVARHLLKDNAFNYDKGVLAEILEPIMGKGLIPADLETWKPRRRAVVPAFHAAYLDAMAAMFARCAARAVERLEDVADDNARRADAGQAPATVDMEQVFLSFGLDVIGLGVFNYDFGAAGDAADSPVVKAVYGVLKEAEHRSTFYIPYWNLPLASALVPRQRAFRADLALLNECLDGLIEGARATRSEDDADALAARDYTRVADPSLLRFLVDARGADLGDTQLRDDLMTMLIAGHETTAAVLTWALAALATNPEKAAKAVAEVDAVVGDRAPGFADAPAMPYVRACLAESLRLYPQPPILIRRALGADTLPPGLNGAEGGYPIGPGADLFISVWNLHRSPHLWAPDPDAFRPERFGEARSNDGFNGAWAGYRPGAEGSASLYPNEVSSDFAFIPFGGGPRKCVGDQFAMMEALVLLAGLLRRFEFSLPGGMDAVGMATGATIHTAKGLNMVVRRRAGVVTGPLEAPAVGVGMAKKVQA
jgi:cytochrome P450